MHGFCTIIAHNKLPVEIKFNWKVPFEFQQKLICRTYNSENLITEQYTGLKFLSEKLWINNSEFFIVTEGIITNLKSLCKEYNANSVENLISTLIKEENFFNLFRGNFAGFIHLKKSGKYFAFNNHCGTKKLFYFQDNKFTIIGTDLYTVGKTMTDLGITKSLDTEAAIFLLTSGFMHENLTLIKEVKQIRAGEYIEKANNTTHPHFYFHLEDIKENNDSRTEIIEKLESLFQKSIHNEYELDKEHQLRPVSTLSGGLDSRMVALSAYKNGFRDQLFFNFSEKGYADELIAKKIAKSYKQQILSIPLEAQSLMDIDDVVKVNDGLTIYTGAGHVFNAIKHMDTAKNGIIHTGILGDAVLGSYLNSASNENPEAMTGVYSTVLLRKKTKLFDKYLKEYRDQEIYKFYNRGFNGINNGFLFFDLCGESFSAFLDPDFVSYALSIPKKYRYKEKIYIDWIKSKHPEFANYIWENIGGKPTNNSILRQIYRFKRAIIKRLPIRSMWKNNMTPEQLWYDKNPEIKNYLDNYFQRNIEFIKFNDELFNECMDLYKKSKITEKSQVLTLLASYKLLFNE